jgi:hypothetical protein
MVGFAGVALILGSGGGFAASGGGSVGYAAALASAVCMTFYTLASGRSHFPADASLLPAAVLGSVFALALCIGGFAPWVWSSAGPGARVASVYAGLGPMAGGFLMWGLAMSAAVHGVACALRRDARAGRVARRSACPRVQHRRPGDGPEGAQLIGVAWLIGWAPWQVAAILACVAPNDFTV